MKNSSTWTQQAKLLSSDIEAGDQFGGHVIYGDTIVAGAHSDDDGGIYAGTAYIFERKIDVWNQRAKLTAGDAARDHQFGGSVTIEEDIAVAGMKYDNDAGPDAGSVYVFSKQNSEWEIQAKLLADDAAEDDFFGAAVALDDDLIVAGAPTVDMSSESGSAYVFAWNGAAWTQQAKLVASDATAGDGFGSSVAISGNTIVVGAFTNDNAGMDAGSVYVFIWNGLEWIEEAELIPIDAVSEDGFGYSVSISGDTIVATSPYDDDAGPMSGSAYVFTRNGTTWSQQAKLTADDASEGDNFGESVSIYDDTVIIGASNNDDVSDDSGSAYVFTRIGVSWTQQDKLLAIDASGGDRFGHSVALYGEIAAIGAPETDALGIDAGSIYIFMREGNSWNYKTKIMSSDIGAGDHLGISISTYESSVIVGASGHDNNAANSGAVYIFNPFGFDWNQKIWDVSDDYFRLCRSPIVEDVNNDCYVNILDLVLISIHFGRQVNDGLDPSWTSIGDGSIPDRADVNDDGVVNILDMVRVAIKFD